MWGLAQELFRHPSGTGVTYVPSRSKVDGAVGETKSMGMRASPGTWMKGDRRTSKEAVYRMTGPSFRTYRSSAQEFSPGQDTSPREIWR